MRGRGDVSDSERKPALAGAVGECLDAAVVLIAAAIEDAGLDSGSSADRMESLIAIGVLTLIGAILLTTVALVTRFFRGTWNP